MPKQAKDLGDSERLTAHEIFESAVRHARDELERPWTALWFSGVAGGLTMGLTGLSTGLVTWLLGKFRKCAAQGNVLAGLAI